MHTAMLRIARIDTPGLLHHIMIRGIERRKIFNDDKDRENFIERLSILLPANQDPTLRLVIFIESRPFSVKKRPRRYCSPYAQIAYRLCGIFFNITPAAVSYAVQRGEKMAKERGYHLEA